MEDEEHFQATMFDFQEVRILHSHSVYHTHTLFTNNHTHFVKYISYIASFPGRSRLQFLIACSMKTEGKAWEKESRA